MMDPFAFETAPARPLKDALDDVAANLAPLLREGFSLLATLPEDKRRIVLKELPDSLDRSYFSAGPDLLAKTGLNMTGARRVLAACTMAAAFLASRTESAAEFIAAGIAAGIIDEASKVGLYPCLEEIQAQRGTLRQVIERLRLTAGPLPTLMSFDVAVDLRFDFRDGSPQFAIPLATLAIGTSDDTTISLQLGEAELAGIIKTLQDAQTKVAFLEARREKFLQ